MTKETKPQTSAETLDDEALEGVEGGLLLPAVQAAREAARRTQKAKLRESAVLDFALTGDDGY